MAQTLSAQLTSVQAAITKIESGVQSVSVDGVTVTRAMLGTLYAREERLLRKISKASSGVARRVCEF